MNQEKVTRVQAQFKKAIDDDALARIGAETGFARRPRVARPELVALCVLCALGTRSTETIADVHRTFLELTKATIHYKPFHNQLAKRTFPEFMRRVLARLVECMAVRVLEPVSGSVLALFRDIVIHDGSSFGLHEGLAAEFPGRFTKVSPAAVEVHASMSLFDDRLLKITVAPDKEGERQFLPTAEKLKGCLELADRGYEDVRRCRDVAAAGGFVIIRFKTKTNPKLKRPAGVQASDPLWSMTGKPLKMARGLLEGRSADLDVVYRKDGAPVELRLVLAWHPVLKRHMALVTNLPREQVSAENVCRLYSLRWQVELLFKEWKSYANLHRFATTKAPIAEGLMWGSLAAAVLKRFFAHGAQHVYANVAISTRRAAMAIGHMLHEVLRAVCRGQGIGDLLKDLLEFIVRAAPRADPARERRRGRLALGLEPCWGGR